MEQGSGCWLNDVFGAIDIQIDSRRLAFAKPSLSLLHLTPTSTPNLRSVLLPWFERGGLPVIHLPQRVDRQHFAGFHERFPQLGDRPLSIGQAADAAHPHPWFKSASIMSDPPQMGCYPAYAIRDKLLLLDGIHRCISHVRNSAN